MAPIKRSTVAMHHVQRGRLERLEEALRKADREAVLDPAAIHPADSHVEVADLGIFGEPEMIAKLGGGLARDRGSATNRHSRCRRGR